jgi:hypothetical protein
MLCDDLAAYILKKYTNRWLKVEVSEDGENGARVTYGKN